jgi:Leucine-rich repeat (LRR) protein
VTLGGFDSRRIQYARMRRLLENYHVPIKQLSMIGRTDLQQRSDMVRIYGEAAGLTDMLMNDQNGAFENPLTQFLKLIYKGRVKPGAFVTIMGKTYKQLDAQYKKHLQVNSELVENHLTRPESRTELSLPAANLKPAAFDSIGRCVNLTLLDLSQNRIRLADFLKLKSCQQLNQVFLTGCVFENDSLQGLELFGKLDDLDLSGSSIQDFQLATFKNLLNLKSLRLAATAITDQGLMQLANVKSLRMLDVSRTKVTNQGIANLNAKLQNLQVTK